MTTTPEREAENARQHADGAQARRIAAQEAGYEHKAAREAKHASDHAHQARLAVTRAFSQEGRNEARRAACEAADAWLAVSAWGDTDDED